MPSQLYDYEGGEFDWFLVDGKGRLALCSSAGFGEVPISVVDGLAESELPTNEISTLIEHMPILGGHRVEGVGPGKCDEFRQLADRGFFVFDWRHWKGPYARILIPDIHAHASSLDTLLLERLRVVSVEGLDFEQSASFQIADLDIDFVSVSEKYTP